MVKQSKVSKYPYKQFALNFPSFQIDVIADRGPIVRPNGLRRVASKPLLLAPLSRARYNSLVPPVSQTIRVKVLFFGRLKEFVGRNEDSAEFSKPATIEHLFAHYATSHPELAKYRSSVVASRNQEFASWDTPLHSGDEVAFLPPVSGG